MEYLIRFAQSHESFRQPEMQALATLAGIDFKIIYYNKYVRLLDLFRFCILFFVNIVLPDEFFPTFHLYLSLTHSEQSPYCIVRLQDEAAARAFISRNILAKDIFELWGSGSNYEEVHADVRRRTEHRWGDYKDVSFRFDIDCFASKRSSSEKKAIIDSFAYLGFDGPVLMKNPDEDFRVLEEYLWEVEALKKGLIAGTEVRNMKRELQRIFFCRWIADSSRELVTKYDLKKRRYISTTSMDAELSLITANMALAAPGKLFYDPFVGTGGFCVAASNFGALTFGSDIDGRSFRGREMDKGKPMGLLSNFQQYNLVSKFVDAFTSDLTNTPLTSRQFLDGIMCDPPYGVREGLRVLGSKDGPKEVLIIDGVPSYKYVYAGSFTVCRMFS